MKVGLFGGFGGLDLWFETNRVIGRFYKKWIILKLNIQKQL